MSLSSSLSSTYNPEPGANFKRLEKAVERPMPLGPQGPKVTLGTGAFKAFKRTPQPKPATKRPRITTISPESTLLFEGLEKTKACAVANALMSDIVHRPCLNHSSEPDHECHPVNCSATRRQGETRSRMLASYNPLKKATTGYGFLSYRIKEKTKAFDMVVGTGENPVLVSRYVPEEVLGSGSQGVALKATDSEQDGAPYALKLSKTGVPHQAGNITEEGYILRELNDCPFTPNIYSVKKYDSVLRRPHVVLAMDLVAVPDICHKYIKEQRTLNPDRLCAFAFNLMLALKSFEEKRIVHLDLKPENLHLGFLREVPDLTIAEKLSKLHLNPSLTFKEDFDALCRKTYLKVIDFGCCHDVGQQMDTNYIQTRWYRSPHSILTGRAVGKADVFSAGAILYEMFVGEPLFSFSSEITKHFKHELQAGSKKEHEDAKNLAHLYTVNAIVGNPKAETIEALLEANPELFHTYYEMQDGQYQLKSLPVKSYEVFERIQIQLAALQVSKLEKYTKKCLESNMTRNQVEYLINFIFGMVDTNFQPLDFEKLLKHPVFDQYRELPVEAADSKVDDEV
ncbi:MAG: hypothetical protein S4CHLAM37_11160 [Chlamydiia bacterium]|nr:hypothetical protein [Chlamydiia bacterium]